MFKALIEKVNKHHMRPLKYHWKTLEMKMLKCPYSVHLNLKCISYDQKKGQE